MKKLCTLFVAIVSIFTLTLNTFALDNLEMLHRIGDKAYYRDVNGQNYSFDLTDINNDGEINILDAILGVEQLKLKIVEEFTCACNIDTLIKQNYEVTVYSEKNNMHYKLNKTIADEAINEAKSHPGNEIYKNFKEVIDGKDCFIQYRCEYYSSEDNKFVVAVGVPI